MHSLESHTRSDRSRTLLLAVARAPEAPSCPWSHYLHLPFTVVTAHPCVLYVLCSPDVHELLHITGLVRRNSRLCSGGARR